MRASEARYRQKNEITNSISVPVKKTSQAFNFDALLKKAENMVLEKSCKKIEKSPMPYEVARVLFWEIYKKMLNEREIEVLPFSQSEREQIKNLILYFLGDEASKYELTKGIWLCGTVGVGKTTLMECFEIFTKCAQSRAFDLVKMKHISYDVKNGKPLNFDKYLKKAHCFDDVCAEDAINIFGNVEEVAQTLIERIYDSKFQKGFVTHCTSNVRLSELHHRYSDPRFLDRCREMYQEIVIFGNSKR